MRGSGCRRLPVVAKESSSHRQTQGRPGLGAGLTQEIWDVLGRLYLNQCWISSDATRSGAAVKEEGRRQRWKKAWPRVPQALHRGKGVSKALAHGLHSPLRETKGEENEAHQPGVSPCHGGLPPHGQGCQIMLTCRAQAGCLGRIRCRFVATVEGEAHVG